MHKAFLTFLAFSTAFVFCKNEPKKAVFLNEFYVRYLADEQKTTAQATFKNGPTAETLTAQLMPEVFFQDGLMRERVLEKLVRYSSEKPGGMDRSWLFRWKNEAGSTQKVALQIDPINDFEIAEPFRATEFALLKWSGAGPLRADEKLTVLFEDEKTGETQPFEFVGPTDLAAVPLAQSRIKPGKWTVALVKTKTEDRTEGSQRHRSTVEFYAKSKSFEIR